MDIETDNMIASLNLAVIYIFKKYKILQQNENIYKVYTCEAKFVYLPLSYALTIVVFLNDRQFIRLYKYI